MKRLTRKSLRNQALFYLARYAASRKRVQDFLARRVAKAEAEGRADVGAEAIAPLLDDLERLGLIDDRAVALTKARSLARRGLASVAIKARLAAQGLDRTTAEEALEQLDGELSSELARAWHYSRKRRLGPYRLTEERADRRQADLAALARRGFSFETARAVIDAPAEAAREREAD